MRRGALIIGSNNAVEPPLNGVEADHRNYSQFLQSDAGGAWGRDEIFHVGATTRADLMPALAAMGTLDFAMVIFAGHGFCLESSGQSYVCINHVESPPVWDLNTGCPRQLTIVDSCRTFLVAEELRKSEKIVLGERLDERRAAAYRASCRRLYDMAIAAADAGPPQIMYASALNESAGDSRSGGVFSTLLVSEAAAWAQRTKKRDQLATQILTTYDAHQQAALAIARRRYAQHPQGDWGRRLVHLPFAVA